MLQANVDSGATLYNYGYDVAGNLTSKEGVTRTYNAANQMVNDGTNSLSYDANGNLLATGYIWDRANRLVAILNTSYAYDGLGNRVAQTVNSVLTEYLNDLQPALPKLLQEVTNGNTTRYIHSLRGIHSMERPTAVGSAVWGTSTWGNFTWGATSSGVLWEQFLQDGLGSVRAIADAAGVVQQSFDYDPYGDPLQAMTGFAFTGEYRDESGLQYHRARYYDPMMSIFPSLDPFEGIHNRPMSLNGYSWVEGNVVMMTDASGNVICSDVYDNSNRNDPNSDFGICINRVTNLRKNYGITLRSETANGVDDWTSTRVNNVYRAVTAIDAKLSPATRRAIGDTNIILVSESSGSEAARASNCSTIRLFLQYTLNDVTYTDWVHTVKNIVHEFGHTFLQYRNSQSFSTWQQISIWKLGESTPVSEDDNQDMGIPGNVGWQFEARENKGRYNNLVGEQAPDMFMFWVYVFKDFRTQEVLR